MELGTGVFNELSFRDRVSAKRWWKGEFPRQSHCHRSLQQELLWAQSDSPALLSRCPIYGISLPKGEVETFSNGIAPPSRDCHSL